jgi:anti-sigma28 factor (negative regulator of flagellin synthesis)
MSVLSQQKNELTTLAENTEVSGIGCDDNKTQKRTAILMKQKIYLLPSIRKKKILEVRKQLVEGTYELDERLNVVLDRLLEDLLA